MSFFGLSPFVLSCRNKNYHCGCVKAMASPLLHPVDNELLTLARTNQEAVNECMAGKVMEQYGSPGQWAVHANTLPTLAFSVAFALALQC